MPISDKFFLASDQPLQKTWSMNTCRLASLVGIPPKPIQFRMVSSYCECQDVSLSSFAVYTYCTLYTFSWLSYSLPTLLNWPIFLDKYKKLHIWKTQQRNLLVQVLPAWTPEQLSRLTHRKSIYPFCIEAKTVLISSLIYNKYGCPVSFALGLKALPDLHGRTISWRLPRCSSSLGRVCRCDQACGSDTSKNSKWKLRPRKYIFQSAKNSSAYSGLTIGIFGSYPSFSTEKVSSCPPLLSNASKNQGDHSEPGDGPDAWHGAPSPHHPGRHRRGEHEDHLQPRPSHHRAWPQRNPFEVAADFWPGLENCRIFWCHKSLLSKNVWKILPALVWMRAQRSTQQETSPQGSSATLLAGIRLLRYFNNEDDNDHDGHWFMLMTIIRETMVEIKITLIRLATVGSGCLGFSPMLEDWWWWWWCWRIIIMVMRMVAIISALMTMMTISSAKLPWSWSEMWFSHLSTNNGAMLFNNWSKQLVGSDWSPCLPVHGRLAPPVADSFSCEVKLLMLMLFQLFHCQASHLDGLSRRSPMSIGGRSCGNSSSQNDKICLNKIFKNVNMK